MRDIRFRAWDIKRDCWALDMGIAQGFLIDVTLGGPKYRTLTIQSPHHERDIVWMQFTGLTDKNGTEIYEGDIVDFDNTTMVVRWHQEDCSFEFFQDVHGEAHTPTSKAKVIGNIYENPELLK